MKQIEGYDLINEAGEFKKLPAGIYKLQIKNVEDFADSEYLKVIVDIIDGEFKGYFTLGGKDGDAVYRSYKEKALPFFKAFITAVEKTNNGYKWDWNEKSLIGKYIVGVYGEEEFLSQENEIKIGVKLQEFRSAEALKEGKIKVPALRVLPADYDQYRTPKQPEPTFTPVADDDLPF